MHRPGLARGREAIARPAARSAAAAVGSVGGPRTPGGGGVDRADPASQRPDLARIRRYYEETWLDYRLLWLGPGDWAIHLGYWGAATRGHADSLVGMNRALARRIGLRPGQRVLDAGCGVGGSAIWLAQTHAAAVVGLTLVPSQAERARRLARARGLGDRVSFEVGDYTRTGFPDASFDVVWALESACYAPDKRLFLAEARRLLRPGGRLGIADFMGTDRPLDGPDERLQRTWLSGWAMPDLTTGTDLARWTAQAGFDDVRLVDVTAHVLPSVRRLHRLAVLLGPGARALHAVGLRSATQQGNVRAARDQYRALQRGLWCYAMLTATAAAR